MSVYRRNGYGDWVERNFENRNCSESKEEYIEQLEFSLKSAKSLLEKTHESSYFDQQIILELRAINALLKDKLNVMSIVIAGLGGLCGILSYLVLDLL